MEIFIKTLTPEGQSKAVHCFKYDGGKIEVLQAGNRLLVTPGGDGRTTQINLDPDSEAYLMNDKGITISKFSTAKLYPVIIHHTCDMSSPDFSPVKELEKFSLVCERNNGFLVETRVNSGTVLRQLTSLSIKEVQEYRVYAADNGLDAIKAVLNPDCYQQLLANNESVRHLKQCLANLR